MFPELDILSCNIRSLRNKVDELESLVAEFKPHLVALTETWLSPIILDSEISLQGYDSFRSDRLARPGGGVILYYHKSLNVTLIESSQNSTGTEEFLCCCIRYGPKAVTIGIVYRSPCSDGTHTILMVEKWRNKSNLIIVGDFNAPGIHWDTLSSTSSSYSFDKRLLEWSLCSNLIQHVLEPTRMVSGQRCNILDLVFTHRASDVDRVSYLPPIDSSDHCVLLFRWLGGSKVHPNLPPRRNVWRIDFNKLRQDVLDTDWAIPTHLNVDEALMLFLSKLNPLLQLHAPLSKRRAISKGPPWIDKELRVLLKKRQKLWNNFKYSGRPSDYSAYKACRNTCTSMKKVKRTAFEKNLAECSKTNPKQLFAYIKRRIKSDTGIPPLALRPDTDELAVDDLSKADTLAKQYGSVYVVEPSPPPEFPTISSIVLDALEITPQEVCGLLQNLRPNSSPGPDDVHPLVLRHLADLISIPVCDIFRRSLDEGRLPYSWKHAVIKPIYKGASRCDPSNYRPISLTSILCKALERLIKTNLQKLMETHRLISPAQHGFRSHRSCISNLLLARETWTQYLDSNKRLDVVFVDFSKAFDKVPHQRLLRKVEAYGIRGKLLSWLSDFLIGRQVQVRVNESLSNTIPACSGVPQGSVLGPELFKIYVNDIPSTIHSECLLYADDLKLWAPITSLQDAQSFQSSLDSLFTWTNVWLLPINFSKCAVLPLGASEPFLCYQLGGHSIPAVSTERDLGVIVSSDLKTGSDTDRRVSTASRLYGAIRRSFACMTPEIFRTLFTTHVRPILEYGLPASFPLTKGESDRIERVQRRGSKTVLGLRDLEYAQRLCSLNLFSLEYRRRRGDLIYARKILRGELGEELTQFFTFNTSGPTRGHQRKLFKPRRRRMNPLITLSTRVINDWNKLPVSVIEATSEARFKMLLDEHLASNIGSSAAELPQT